MGRMLVTHNSPSARADRRYIVIPTAESDGNGVVVALGRVDRQRRLDMEIRLGGLDDPAIILLLE